MCHVVLAVSFSVTCVIQELIHEPPDEKAMRRNTVLRKFAFHQFTQYKFQESLDNYLKIKEGVLHCVKLCQIVLLLMLCLLCCLVCYFVVSVSCRIVSVVL